MKKIIAYGFLFWGLAMMFNACRKDDVQPSPDPRFPLPLLTIDTTGDEFISGKDPASFLGKFIIDMYYGTAVKPRKVDIVVIRNDNKTNVKTIKADVTSFPASIEITGIQLTTLFDSTIKLGDKFEIGADVTTTNGQKFEAFPAAGNPYGADTTALPGFNFSIVYVAACVFDRASFSGWYTAVRDTWEIDAWGDIVVGDPVLVMPGPGENDISVFAYPYNDYFYTTYATVCHVDPVTFDVTIERQVVGQGPVSSWPLIYVESGTGTVHPCGDAITLNMTLTAYDTKSGVLELRK